MNLLGAPLHWGAKGMSLIVGLVLGAAALLALARGNGVIGLFAANHLTELVWGAAGVLLIVLSLLPRVGGKTKRRDEYEPTERRHQTRRGEREPQTVQREPAHEAGAREPVRDQTAGVARESSSTNDRAPGARVASTSRTTPQRADTNRQ